MRISFLRQDIHLLLPFKVNINRDIRDSRNYAKGNGRQYICLPPSTNYQPATETAEPQNCAQCYSPPLACGLLVEVDGHTHDS